MQINPNPLTTLSSFFFFSGGLVNTMINRLRFQGLPRQLQVMINTFVDVAEISRGPSMALTDNEFLGPCDVNDYYTTT